MVYGADEYTSYREMSVATTNGGFVCLPCGLSITHSSSLKRHFMTRHVELGFVFVCPACRKVCRIRRYFEEHIRTRHPELRGLEMKKCVVRK